MQAKFSAYLNVVRFLAAFAVFIGHSSVVNWTGGLVWQVGLYAETSVVIFFVLSGFVIAHVIDNKKGGLCSLKGKKAPVIDGLTCEQHLYMGWAQVLAFEDARTAADLAGQDRSAFAGPVLRQRIAAQPSGLLCVWMKQGNRMYLAPKERVIIW